METFLSRPRFAPTSNGHPRVKAGRGCDPLRTVKLKRIGNLFTSRVVLVVIAVRSWNPLFTFNKICSGAPGKALANPVSTRPNSHYTDVDVDKNTNAYDHTNRHI